MLLLLLPTYPVEIKKKNLDCSIHLASSSIWQAKSVSSIAEAAAEEEEEAESSGKTLYTRTNVYRLLQLMPLAARE